MEVVLTILLFIVIYIAIVGSILSLQYFLSRFHSPNVRLLRVDANQGAILEIKNRKEHVIQFDLMTFNLNLNYISAGGCERIFNLIMQPGEVRHLVVPMSRQLVDQVGRSRLYSIYYATYKGSGWFGIKQYAYSWFTRITSEQTHMQAPIVQTQETMQSPMQSQMQMQPQMSVQAQPHMQIPVQSSAPMHPMPPVYSPYSGAAPYTPQKN